MIIPSAGTLFTALMGGILPAVFWLWFWRKEDAARPEPRGLVLLLFLAGMISVALVIPIQKYAYANIVGNTLLLTSWASIEEIMKFLAFFVVAAKSRFLDEPVDFAVDMITVALGFAALENTLFLMNSVEHGSAIAGLLTGDLRFIGATLLHITASAFVGLSMGFAFFKGPFHRTIYLLFGLLTAITLHTLFNFFIMGYKDQNIFVVFGFLWVAVVIVMLLFEKVKNLR